MAKSKCIIILSEKSSGSSACQALLAKIADIRHVNVTRHNRHETLYWTKAASILNKPQLKMVDSEVPLSAVRARRDLLALFSQNLDGFTPPADDTDMIMKGWYELCRAHSPIFLEKSPHHLCQWHALELLMKCMDEATDVEFQIIGLIRNPMATIYSQFQQWRSPPAKLEQQWRVAYQNLLRLKERLDDRVILLQYKEMVTSTDWLYPVAKFCELNFADVDKQHMHARSLEKWKQDRWFGHQLTDETRDLARQFGYDDAELSHTSYATWPIVWRAQRLSYRLSRPLLSTAYRLSARLRGIDVSE